MAVRTEIDEGAEQARQVSKLWWLLQGLAECTQN
jgi:hypothetical protein